VVAVFFSNTTQQVGARTGRELQSWRTHERRYLRADVAAAGRGRPPGRIGAAVCSARGRDALEKKGSGAQLSLAVALQLNQL